MPYIIKLRNTGGESLKMAHAASEALVLIGAYLARGYELTEIRDATRNIELSYEQLLSEADAARD